jgi:hypothetical protein
MSARSTSGGQHRQLQALRRRLMASAARLERLKIARMRAEAPAP